MALVSTLTSTLPARGLALKWVVGPAIGAGLLLAAAGCANGPAGATGGVFSQPPTPTEAVAMMFNRDDPDQRREGINWLSAAPFGGDDVYLESYRLFYNDPDASARAACAKALGLHGTVEDANLLIVMLEDDQPQVRWQAANGLRRIHSPAAAGPLSTRVSDTTEPDSDVRQAAADALGQYADSGVFNALTRSLEDRNYAVIAAAHRSLVTLTGHDAGLDPRDWSAWARAQQGGLFAGQRPYTYAPYQHPPGFTDTLRFWRKPEAPAPQAPRGYEVAER